MKRIRILVANDHAVVLEGLVALIGRQAASSGVVISTYRPSGPLRTGSFDGAAA
jgi:hypothetical protein